MPVGIVAVMNNTKSVLHYTNTETGYKFDVKPTNGGNSGTISTSQFHDDTVPFKSSNRVVSVTIADGGPSFTVTDDYYKFNVVCDLKSQEWVKNFSNGDQFVMRVDPHGMSIVKFEEGLRPLPGGLLVNGPNVKVTEDYPNAVYAMKFC